MRTRKYAVKQDANHTAIVNGLRKLGYAVLDLKNLGGGAPDLLVTVPRRPTTYEGDWINHWWFVEIKTDKGTLNAKQKKWRENWTGPQPVTARSLEDLLRQIQG